MCKGEALHTVNDPDNIFLQFILAFFYAAWKYDFKLKINMTMVWTDSSAACCLLDYWTPNGKK